MLGSQPILKDESIDTSAQGNVADEVPERVGGSPVEPPTMHVNDRGFLSGLRRLGPPSGYPSDCSGFEGYTFRDRNPFHNAVERTAGSGSFEPAFHGRDGQSQSGHSNGIFPAKRMYSQPRGFRG
jgi:hypothetical protein